MYRKIVWCYVIILTLLDISLNTKLTAQGKSHGAGLTVHDSLVEGITFNEWGKDGPGEGGAGAGGEGGAGGGARAPLRLEPAVLSFGARALGAAHAATVTLTNTANTTLHLASVAGTTPDFHASFFESKTLPPEGNTTFTVVYLGRREGPVSAHLYIHTALGVHKYPVSAEGVPSEWGVWPLLGLRVPANATLQPLLTLTNPTDHPIQVSEVYSSGGWVRLSLPGGGAAAAREAWLVPPHAARPLVRLDIAAPHHDHAATAYVRIKANITGGGLIVGVEARGAPPGEYAAPVHLRLRARGARDPADTFSISVGSSASGGARLEAAVWGARCLPAPAPSPAPDPAPSPAPAPGQTATDAHTHTHNKHTQNGVKSEGAYISLLRSHLEPYQELTRAAELTLDYEKLWAGYINGASETEHGASSNGAGAGGVGAGAGAGGAWCSGVVRLGRAALPYSLRLLPGTLTLTPKEIDFITADSEQSSREVELKATNEFLTGINILHLEIPDEVKEHFLVSGGGPRLLPPARSAALLALRLRTRDPALRIDSKLVVHTNVSQYTVPLKVYSGKLELEWDWPNSSEGRLWVGAVGTSSTRRVACTLRNPAPRALCVTHVRAALPGASLALTDCAPASSTHTATTDDTASAHSQACRCVEAGGARRGVLTLVAPARAGALRGAVSVSTPHAATSAAVLLTAVDGRLHAPPLHLDDAAPYAWSVAPVVLESTMSLRMRVEGAWGVEGVWEGGGRGAADPALRWRAPAPADAEIGAGRSAAGALEYRPERLCEPHCYTGLDPHSPEGAGWVSAGLQWGAGGEGGAGGEAAAWRADRALLAARRARYHHTTRNISLHLRTSQVVQVPVTGWVRLHWPRLVRAGAGGAGGAGGGAGAGWAGLAGVGGAATLRVAVRNPSRSHTLILQPVLGPPPQDTIPDVWEGAESPVCMREECVYAADAFSLDEWRAVRGQARVWAGAGAGAGSSPENAREDTKGEAGEDTRGEERDPAEHPARRTRALPFLQLDPAAEIELKITFTPRAPSALTAYLYLRNNLTIVEGLQLAGRGAFPSFELGGRRPGAAAPLVFEVTECGAGGVVRRTVAARNTGPVGVRLREWRVAGALCANRGFALAPCAPLTLQPNQSAALTLTFTPDYTLARATATLELTAAHAPRATLAFRLAALAAPRVLARCLPLAPRPPWEPSLRAAGALAAIALLALVLAAAALDAERLLRRARAARAAAEPRAPLDLRAVAAAPAPAPPPPAAPAGPRAPPPRRRKTRKVDPQAESRAFERWRASLRRHDDDDERSSEDAENDERGRGAPDPAADDAPLVDSNAYEASETAPISAYEPIARDPHARGSSGDDEAHSSSSESSSPPEPDDEDAGEERAHEPGAAPAPAHPASEPGSGAERLTRVEAHPAPGEPGRALRRREPDARRSERRGEDGQRTRPSGAKHHARKDKPSKRRDRAPPTPPRADPPPCEPRAPPAGPGAGAGAVRWGASWSSVVARSTAPPTPPAALAPIGSDVRRAGGAGGGARAEEAAAPRSTPSDNSLFYFNGEAARRPEPEYAWRAPHGDGFGTPTRDFLDEPVNVGVGGVSSVGSVGGVSGSYGSIGPVWGSSLEARAPGAAWPWPSYNNTGAVRPPPGFGTTPPGAVGSGGVGSVGGVSGVGAIGTAAGGARVVRAFDPFHSLAAIWSRNALDWRSDEQDDR